MSQATKVIPNQSRTNFRLAVQAGLQAQASFETGAVGALAETYPNQMVMDTTSGHILKRNHANDDWDYLESIDRRILASAVGTDAYAVTYAPAINAYKNGVIYRFKADVANTGAATFSANGLAAKDVKKLKDGAIVALEDNDIIANHLCLLLYDATADVMLLLNPTAQIYQGLKKLATVTLSADASKTISTALLPGHRYKLAFNLVQNTSNGVPYLKFNNDVGTNYSANNLGWLNAAVAALSLGAQTNIWLAVNGDQNQYLKAGETIFGSNFEFQGDAARKVRINGEVQYVNATGAFESMALRGLYTGAADLSRLDIATSAGTLTGTVTLYELL